MFIAHLPAGYLTAATAQRFGLWSRGLMLSCLAGAHIPDIDLAYGYLVDDGRLHHHLYWTHYPIFWLVLLLLSTLAWWRARRKSWAIALFFFCGSAFIHLLLDAIAGDIPLLAPWSMRLYSCVEVGTRFEPWWLNFLMHWTFVLELALCAAAAAIFMRRSCHSLRRTIRRCSAACTQAES